MDERIFWSGWQGPVRVALFGVLAYLFLIVILRATGKRTLSKMNAFDFVVTVASGSSFATVLLNKSVSLAEGFTAFFMLVFMQYVVAWVTVRSERVEALIKSTPAMLVWNGSMLRDAMRRERVSETEILAACRETGYASLDRVQAVVLEPAGTFSVISVDAASGKRDTLAPCSAVPHVRS